MYLRWQLGNQVGKRRGVGLYTPRNHYYNQTSMVIGRQKGRRKLGPVRMPNSIMGGTNYSLKYFKKIEVENSKK